MSTTSLDRIAVDFLILADFAEVVNGKLYVMGGGWDRKLHSSQTAGLEFGFAAGMLVPWTLANEEHRFSIGIEDADGNVLGKPVEGGLKVGRPIQSVAGQAFRALIAGRLQGPSLEPGTYAIRLSVGPDLERRAVFYIVEQL